MAFMVPVMKKEYSLYSNNLGPPKLRRPSEQLDGSRRGQSADGKRKSKPGDPSLASSPSAAMVAVVPRTKPIELKRVRGSAPALIPTRSQQTTPLHQNNQKAFVRPSTSAPTGNDAPSPYSPSRSSKSSSSSSSSESTGAFGKLHSRLVRRLRKTLHLKDPESIAAT